MTIKKIGILTGGGDCPGLNSVIYGILLKAFDAGVECVGILKGWKGLMENLTIPLNIAEHDDLHTIGGTILYTSRTNPFKGAESKENIKCVCCFPLSPSPSRFKQSMFDKSNPIMLFIMVFVRDRRRESAVQFLISFFRSEA